MLCHTNICAFAEMMPPIMIVLGAQCLNMVKLVIQHKKNKAQSEVNKV
jgi:hypothetical protein